MATQGGGAHPPSFDDTLCACGLWCFASAVMCMCGCPLLGTARETGSALSVASRTLRRTGSAAAGEGNA
eukprot:16437463-Heterocapsa_arctica.AAC.1